MRETCEVVKVVCEDSDCGYKIINKEDMTDKDVVFGEKKAVKRKKAE